MKLKSFDPSHPEFPSLVVELSPEDISNWTERFSLLSAQNADRIEIHFMIHQATQKLTIKTKVEYKDEPEK